MSKKLQVKEIPAIQTKPRYRVSDLGSIMLPHQNNSRNTQVLNPGQVLPDDCLSSSQIQKHLDSGYLVRVGQQETSIPGITLPWVLGPQSVRKGGREDDVRVERMGFQKQLTFKDVPMPDPTVVGRWNLNPKKLSHYDLGELRHMIRSRDSRMTLPETRQAALDQLSRDFTGEDELQGE